MESIVAEQLELLPEESQRQLIDSWLKRHNYAVNSTPPSSPTPSASYPIDSFNGTRPLQRFSMRSTSSATQLGQMNGASALDSVGASLIQVVAPEGISGIITQLRKLNLHPNFLSTLSSVTLHLSNKPVPGLDFLSLIERNLSTILLLTPSFMLRSTRPGSIMSSAATAAAPHLLSGYGRSGSNYSFLSTATTSSSASSSDEAVETTPTTSIKIIVSCMRNLKDLIDSLCATVEVTESDRLVQQCAAVAIAVRKLKDWEGGLGRLEDARGIYAALIACSVALVSGIVNGFDATESAGAGKRVVMDAADDSVDARAERRKRSMTTRLKSFFASAGPSTNLPLSKRRSMSSFASSSGSAGSESLLRTPPNVAGDLAIGNERSFDGSFASRLPDVVHEEPLLLERPASSMEFSAIRSESPFGPRSMSHGELEAIKQKASQITLSTTRNTPTLTTSSSALTLIASDPANTMSRPDRWSKLLLELTKNSNAALERLTISKLDVLRKESVNVVDNSGNVAEDAGRVEDSADVDDEVVLSTLRRALVAIQKKHGTGDETDNNSNISTSGEDEKGDADALPKDANRIESSLKVIGVRGAQRIPTFDSQGRRIGILDHGRFISEPADSQSDSAITATGGASIAVRGNLLYLSESNLPDALVMELVNGRLIIVDGTLEKLLLRLADENIQDMEFVDLFLHFHTFFIKSVDLFDCLSMRYAVSPPADPSAEELEYYSKWRRPIQLKVLTVICRWIKLQFEIFAADGSLRDRVEEFLRTIWNDGFRTEADRIRRTAAAQASTIAQRTLQAPHPIQSLYYGSSVPLSRRSRAPNPLPFPDMLRTPSASSRSNSIASVDALPQFLNLDVKDVARYMTVADRNAFAALGVIDFLAKLEGSGIVGGEIGLRVDMFAARANMVRNWVALEICCVKSIKHRRKAIEKFISVAKHCRDLNNFHTSLIITSGLLSAPVQRLKKTWDGVQNRDLGQLVQLEHLLDPSSNMRALRRAQAAAQSYLPFFPLVMKDITFLNDGNGGGSDGRVSVGKYRSLLGLLRGYGVIWGLPRDRFVADAVGGEAIPSFVEGRLVAAGDDDKAMDIAWNNTVGIGGEDITG